MPELSRRELYALAGGAATVTFAAAASRTQGVAATARIPLWPGEAPGAIGSRPIEKIEAAAVIPPARPFRRAAGIAEPWLWHVPAAKPNGAALLLAPGGGYASLSIDREGFHIAERLAKAGIASFILVYRLPAEGWADRADTPLADAQRAIRLIRAGAARWRIDPARVGMMGFSAGGHLCADLAARHGFAAYAPVDAIDALPAKPMLVAPLYPVVSMDPVIAHKGSRDHLLGDAPDGAATAAHSVDLQVTKDNPPTFIATALDDATVKPVNSVRLQAALTAAGVPVEAHYFATGGHGFSLGADKPGGIALWPDLFLAWARARGLFA